MMKWLKLSWKIGLIGEVEIHLHISMLFSLLATYYIFRPTDPRHGLLAVFALIGFVFSVFLHEGAHALAARLVKIKTKRIVLWLLGGFTILSHEPEKPVHRLLIYLAGPLATAVLGALFFVIYYYMPPNLPFFWIYIYSRLFLALTVLNIALFIFNILPVYPLDGGNILHALMELLFGKPGANLITMIISIPVLIGLIVLGFYTRDYILLVVCAFIALAISTLHWRTMHWVELGLSYLLRRGAYYYLLGDYDRALHSFTREVERKPEQAVHYFRRAACYVFLSQPTNALADLQHALTLAPNDEMCLLLRGDLFFIDKDYDTALEWYEKARQLYPNSALPYYCRGCVRRVKQEFQAALDDFNQAIALRMVFPLCYIERSKVHFKLGNLDAAHKDQEAALLLSEKDALTRAEFNLQVYNGYLDWVEDYYARVLLKRPRSWYAYQGRADAYRANNEHEKAIADYTKALDINPHEPRLYLGRGKSYQANGAGDCAAADFRQVLAVTDRSYLWRQAEESLMALNGESGN
jgi:tetratricopeptide (TPR) repeat protein